MTATGVTYARGFAAGTARAGVKPGTDRDDVAVIASDRACAAAAIVTSNEAIAAPCVVTRRHVARGVLRGVVVNSGNANACTGDDGLKAAERMARAAAARLGVAPEDMAVASTGVIGVPLPVERIESALAGIALSPDGGAAVARAIMTTDTRPKLAQREVEVGGRAVRIGGIAKGAGMIHPDMATLLAFITTDAHVSAPALDAALRSAADQTFNVISVDGDTSTNDTLLALANGASGVALDDTDLAEFTSALTDVCGELARAVVADGEGATKTFEVRVSGGRDVREARLAARAISSSNLVKTAVHGADPNWGRVIAAAGRSGARVDVTRASVRIGDVSVFAGGAPAPFDAADVRRVFEQESITIDVHLGAGDASARAWGCDLTAEYVRINADYTT